MRRCSIGLRARARGKQILGCAYHQTGLEAEADNAGLKRIIPLDGVRGLVVTHPLADLENYSIRSHFGHLSMSAAQGRVLWPGVLIHEGLEEPTLKQKAGIDGGVYSILEAESTSPDVLTRRIIEDDVSGIIKHALWAVRNSFQQNIDRWRP